MMSRLLVGLVLMLAVWWPNASAEARPAADAVSDLVGQSVDVCSFEGQPLRTTVRRAKARAKAGAMLLVLITDVQNIGRRPGSSFQATMLEKGRLFAGQVGCQLLAQ